VQVELSSTAEKQLAKIPGHIVKKFALWVDLACVEGLSAARTIPGQAGTIQLVYVEEVNKHDY
jgi:hypothetical protein